jgi:anti-anti-sigma factor
MDQLVPAYPLSGKLTIYEVAELKPLLANWLGHSESRLELDLSGIDEIDSAGVQLLALLKQESQKQGKTLVLHRHSAMVQRIFVRMGVVGLFGDPLVLTGENP